jgi:hypothetical protein
VTSDPLGGFGFYAAARAVRPGAQPDGRDRGAGERPAGPRYDRFVLDYEFHSYKRSET